MTGRAAGLGPAGGPVDTDELLRLVLNGGISTSPAVTEVAGRGIGMDAVRAVAARLSGEVTVRSVPGQGATVELIIPLALLAMTGLVVEATDTLGWNGDALEAEGFAYMAVRTLRGLPISFPGTTGVPVAMTGGVVDRV